MQNSERQPFDQSWRSAFDGAEMSPPDSLWNNIQMELAARETDLMKRRVVFYQRIAAATVLFALVTGGVAVYNYREGTDLASGTEQAPVSQPSVPQLSLDQATATAEIQSPGITALSEQSVAQPSNPTMRKQGGKDNNTNTTGGSKNPAVATAPPVPVTAEEDDKLVVEQSPVNTIPDDRQLAANERPVETEVASPVAPEDKPAVELLSADQINAIAEAKEQEEKEKDATNRSPWVGVSGAAGSYTPSASVGLGYAMADADGAGPNSYSSLAASQGIPQSYRHTVGSAYSAGVSGGLKLSKRWVVQSGINYISQQVDYTTNFVGITTANRATAMSYEFLENTSLDVAVTNPYEASSTTEILSVPVQAGFLIVDRKIGWQLSTGVSTDFFLRNTLADKSGSREKISEGGGEESPYRSVNWSGLLNTELSYRIGNHYRLAVVPGLRYAFQPLLKGQSTGAPLIADIGFRFNYLFN